MTSKQNRNTVSNIGLRLKQYKGTSIEINLSKYRDIVSLVRSRDIADWTNKAITDRALVLAQTIDCKQSLDTILPDIFTLATESASRSLGIAAYDEQLMAAAVLHQGKLVQMQTGEGKTLSAAITAALNGMTGSGVHILTANEYLAKRDAEWMGPIYRLLGLRVSYVHDHMSVSEKREAYAADITYLTAKQAGFDFLYDNTQYDLSRRVQRPFSMCIVDEADFIMIDEARIPLVIAKESDTPRADPVSADRIAADLTEDTHYKIDRQGRVCVLTLEGQQEIEAVYGCGGMHEDASTSYYAGVNVALHAHHLLARDVDYIVRNGRIELVDEFTGRVVDKRKWPYGIQTALEVKERLRPQREGSVCGSITVQHFVQLYPKVAAMTATAVSAAEEFSTFYELCTVIIPPHKTERMDRLDDRIFTTSSAKLDALVDEIQKMHGIGRPILVGTRSVRESTELSSRLLTEKITHRVLNAENDEEEAPIIARAGMPGAVTISTNMAGRGTDIRLGGPDGEHHRDIVELGGLYVVGTNRHESARIDNQLLGRAARQGDPGSGRFFISLEDPLIEQYAITEFIPEEYIQPDATRNEPILDRRVMKEIDRAQEIIEGQHFQMRRTLRRYTDIVEKQRSLLFGLRNDALESALLPDKLIQACELTLDRVESRVSGDDVEETLSLIFAHELDEFWIDHLQWVDTVREGIHLRRLGKRDPQLDYLTDATDAFDIGLDRAITRAAQRFETIIDSPNEIAALKKAILQPSSTWTYMINDNPFPSFRLSILGGGTGVEAAGAMVSAVAAPFVLMYGIWKAISRLFTHGKTPEKQMDE
jgi:preprotein translocase subunit SecA